MLRTLWAGILAFMLDRVSKVLAIHFLAPSGQYDLLPGVLHLRYTENKGMAFSLLAATPWVLVLLSLAAMLLVCFALRTALKHGRLENIMTWLLLAGGTGNLVDRLFYGHVVDFFEIRPIPFAIFNLADVFLSVAVAVFIIRLLCPPTREQRSGTDEAEKSTKTGKRDEGQTPAGQESAEAPDQPPHATA
ncbi:MAG: signal peptidase II [Oscillospiraceae bacterium]|jgi:signal peptidase II|nr:signal peptidase II [Oscillospiraceae bacterium]